MLPQRLWDAVGALVIIHSALEMRGRPWHCLSRANEEDIPVKRVARFQAEMARELLPRARDTQDPLVIAACIRVRNCWLLGHRVAKEDLELVEAFSE